MFYLIFLEIQILKALLKNELELQNSSKIKFLVFSKALFRYEFSIKFPKKWCVTRTFSKKMFFAWRGFLWNSIVISQRIWNFFLIALYFLSENSATPRLAWFQNGSLIINRSRMMCYRVNFFHVDAKNASFLGYDYSHLVVYNFNILMICHKR